jgi:hypothetical protein
MCSVGVGVGAKLNVGVGVGTWPGVIVVVGNRNGCSGGVVEGGRVSFGVGGKETRDGEDTAEACVILVRSDRDR